MCDDAELTSSDFRPDERTWAKHNRVHEAVEEISDFLDAHKSVKSAGLAGITLEPDDATITLYWVGPLPAALADVIGAAITRHDVSMTVVPARYTEDELDDVSEHVWAETDGVIESSPTGDGRGISVTIDPDVFADPHAHRSTHPAVIEYVAGEGDGNYGDFLAESNAQRSASLPRAAQMWAGFPADRDPRPLVLLENGYRPSGHTTGAAKQAAHLGFTVSPGVPQAAKDAILHAGLRADYLREDTGSATAATLTTYRFMTDRGRQRLRAWNLTITHTLGSNYLLTDEERARAWPYPDGVNVSSSTEATIDTDDRTLHYTYYGEGENICDLVAVEIVDTAGSVAVLPLLQYRPGGWRHMSMSLETRTDTVTLPHPLAGRVLVDDSGTPVTVTPSRSPRRRTHQRRRSTR